MNSIMKSVKHFITSEDGPTAVEYAVLLALIIIGAIGILITLGGQITGIFTNASTQINAVPGGAAS